MDRINLYILIISLFGVVSCTDDAVELEEDRFVVEAFLFANEPVSGIRVKGIIPLNDPDSVAPLITEARVLLMKDGNNYELSVNEDDEYEYTGNDLTVSTGDIFDIEVTYGDITATASTVVPAPTTGLQISESEILLPEIVLPTPGGGGGFGGGGATAVREAIMSILSNSLIVEWDNPNQELYFMVVENLVDELDPIFPDRIANRLRRFRFVSEPTNENFMEFSLANLETFGQHVIKVYHVNQEYADLYENLNQDSRDLNEPPSNIKNGLGVFSAFNSQNVYFDVKKE
ncbi:MAG: DUF4249 family protein [Cyclobacteriaceae bacterium]